MRALCLAALAGCAGASPPPRPPAASETGPEVAVSVRLLDAGETEAGTPRSEAQLVLIYAEGGRDMTPIGTFEGVCSHEAPDARAVLRVRCWWAGAGTVLRVARVADRLEVLRVALDGEARPGDPERALDVALPPGARLRPIGAEP